MTKRELKIFSTGILLFALFLTGLAQKPHNASKALEINNLRFISTFRTLDGQMDKQTGVWRVKTKLNVPIALGTPEQMALNFVKSNSMGVLGKNSDMELKAVFQAKTPIGDHVRLQQYYQGIPVYNSEMTVTINRNKNAVTSYANYLRTNVNEVLLNESIGKESALEIAKNHLQVSGKIIAQKSQLSILETKNAGAKLTHHVTIVCENPIGDWQVFVDAASGEVLHVKDIANYANGGGFVFNPDPLTTAEVEYGGAYIDSDDTDVAVLNAERDSVMLQDLTYEGGLYKLAGPYCVLEDIESPSDVFPELADSSAFNFTRSQQEFEDVNVYFHIDLSYRRIMEVGFAIPGLLNFRSDPHGLNGDDNSHYMPSENYCAWGDGGVDDAEDADVVWHEYGHAIQTNATGGMSYTGETQSLQEGCSDYWAGSYSRSVSEYGWGRIFSWDGHNPFWAGRVCDYTAANGHYPEDYVSGHNGGQIWSSALMAMWNDLGRDVIDELFLGAHFLWGSSPNLQAAADFFIQADIDLYGGSHLTTIVSVFDERGLVNAEDYIPTVSHTPLTDTEDITGPYTVLVNAVAGIAPLDSANMFVVYGYENLDDPDTLDLMPTATPTLFSADIPATTPAPFNVVYYVGVADQNDNLVLLPSGAPTNTYSFYAGADVIAPEITHSQLGDQAYIRWPATVTATVTDNSGVDSVWVEYGVNSEELLGRFTLASMGDDGYQGIFNIDTNFVNVGDTIHYRIGAVDIAGTSNTVYEPESENFSFEIISTKGLILVINDDVSKKTTRVSEKGTFIRDLKDIGAASDLFESVLTAGGYVATVVTMTEANAIDFAEYDLIIHSSGANETTVSDATYRAKLVDWIAGDINNKLLVEGGEVGWNYRSDAAFGAGVLKTDDWNADNAGAMLANNSYSDHPMLTNVYDLPASISINYVDYGDQDAMSQIGGAYPLYVTTSYSEYAGIGIYDATPSTVETAQSVYFAFNLAAVVGEDVQTALIENAVEYLLTPEPVVGIEDDNNFNKPNTYSLEANYPNPFNPTTMISYSIVDAQKVTLTIFNTMGQKVRSLVNGHKVAGKHIIEWNGKNDANVQVPSGIYFYRLNAGTFLHTRKMILLK